ncbi:MAG: DUF814 domain-containing protein, partial [Planctomycetes bacterium]|nr:DUF814 domain-containing protein [Planctomycetota bacterium]
LRRQGELIKANLGNLQRGMREAVVLDYFAGTPGATAAITLDPSRPPRETMEKHFKKAAKLERGRIKIAGMLRLNHEKIAMLTQLFADFDAWEEAGEFSQLPEELLAIAKSLRLQVDKLQATAAKPRSKKQQQQDALLKRTRSFTSHDGMEILVGRTGEDNDILTFRLARGSDWWLHVAATPGSHVVVRTPRGESLPQETLLDAAHLAVYYSKMRSAAAADVTLALASQIRRIKGAPPGKVRVERSQTIHVRMEAARLARLVKTTLGD